MKTYLDNFGFITIIIVVFLVIYILTLRIFYNISIIKIFKNFYRTLYSVHKGIRIEEKPEDYPNAQTHGDFVFGIMICLLVIHLFIGFFGSIVHEVGGKNQKLINIKTETNNCAILSKKNYSRSFFSRDRYDFEVYYISGIDTLQETKSVPAKLFFEANPGDTINFDTYKIVGEK